MKKRKWFAGLLAVVIVLAMFAGMVHAEEGLTAYVNTKEDFVAAVNDESITEIYVTADIDLTNPNGENGSNVLSVSGKIIDLGGNVISADNFTLFFEGSDFVLQNGTFDANGGSYALFIGDEDITDNVLIQNVTTAGGINVYNATNVTLRYVDVVGTQYYAVWCDNNGKVTIESGNFQSASTVANAVLGLTRSESKLTIDGGHFAVEDGQALVLKNGDTYGKPVISGGVFNTNPVDYISENSSFIRYISDEKTIYALGSSVNEVLADTNNGDAITILQGSITMTNVAEGVSVTNLGTGTVIVNGSIVDTNGQITTTHDVLKIEAKAATCSEAGNIEHWYCTDCGKYFSDEELTDEITETDTIIAATGHQHVNKSEAKAATCSEAGNIEHWYCTDCGKYFSDEELTDEITETDTIIAATGHQ
ncbi:MAG: hypothetical protein HFE78_06910, partial [Clostridiales bacterium]|nr:hypothetical protein [Clostridiales bacterium]